MGTGIGAFLIEVLAIVRSFLGGSGKGRKILIFGNGRSGSTLLQQMLMPDERCFDMGEILRKRRKRAQAFPNLSKIQALCSNYMFVNGQAEFHLNKRTTRQVCVHIKPMHVGLSSIPAFLNSAINDGWVVIQLYRSPRDVLISAEKAKATKIWHTVKDNAKESMSAKDLGFAAIENKMLRGIKIRWKWNESMQVWGRKHDHISCHYDKNLSTQEKQRSFLSYLALEYPFILTGTDSIRIKRNAAHQYTEEDFAVITRLKKEEEILHAAALRRVFCDKNTQQND